MTAMSACHQESTNVLNDATAQYDIENTFTEPRPCFFTCAPLQLLRSHTCSMPYARVTLNDRHASPTIAREAPPASAQMLPYSCLVLRRRVTGAVFALVAHAQSFLLVRWSTMKLMQCPGCVGLQQPWGQLRARRS